MGDALLALALGLEPPLEPDVRREGLGRGQFDGGREGGEAEQGQHEARAFGTGVFYSIYYVQMMLVPQLAGTIADRVGDVGVAFILGGLMMALAAAALAVFVGTATPPRTAGT